CVRACALDLATAARASARAFSGARLVVALFAHHSVGRLAASRRTQPEPGDHALAGGDGGRAVSRPLRLRAATAKVVQPDAPRANALPALRAFEHRVARGLVVVPLRARALAFPGQPVLAVDRAVRRLFR